MLNYMDRVLLNQAAKQIKSDLGFAAFSWNGLAGRDYSDFNYSFLESAFGIAYALGALFFGWASDRFSVVWLYPACVVGWSLAGVGSGFAQDYPQMLASRCLLGFFEAANWPCGLVTTRALLTRERRGLGNGILHGGGALGAMVTPILLLAFSLPGGWSELFRAGSLSDLLANKSLVPDWRLAFLMVGGLGGLWAVLWLIFALPKQDMWKQPSPSNSSPEGESAGHFFIRFIQDRRFWILLVTVCSINTTWHILRVWLPLYLQEAQDYTLAQLSFFSMVYYLMADIGALGAGALTLILAKKRGVDSARFLVFCLGSLGCLLTWGIATLEDGWALRGALWIAGLASMSLFPLYFAQTQDIAPSHTGKITGLMGFFCWIFLFFTQAAAGSWIGHRKETLLSENAARAIPIEDSTRQIALRAYSEAIGVACLPPVLALGALAFWPKRTRSHLAGTGKEIGTL